MTPPRLLGPAARPKPPLPRLPLALLGGVLLFAALAGWTDAKVLLSISPAMSLVALVAGAWLGGWLEARAFLALAGRAGPLRLLGSLALAVLTPLGLFAAGVVGAGLAAAGLDASAFGAVITIPLWLGGAATGSAIVLAVDVAVSFVLQDFRARVTAAVLALLAVALAASTFVSTLAQALVTQLLAGDIPKEIRLDVDGPRAEQELADALAWVTAHPTELVLIIHAIAALLALPVILSAATKLAEAVMDRIHPLAAAFDAVAAGDRDVVVEEGGSSDFRRLAGSFNRMLASLALAERMERAFGLYVSGHLMERIRGQHGEARIPASLREATVFFCDVRGFTSMSERLAPEEVVALLNTWFERVVAEVDRHQGYLNKFIGDAVVVVFNGPIDQPDHAARATRCAIALQEACAELNAQGAFAKIEALRVGVGVATGPMVCGNVGGARQMEYTVIGDTVNLSSRLTSLAGAGEVWVSEATAAALPAELSSVAQEPVKVKGKALAVVPHRVWPR